MFTEKQWYARRHHSPFAHIRAYAIRPHSWRQKLTRNDTSHHRIPQRTNSKYVGAYRIRPPHGRTRQKMGMFTEKQWYARHHHSLFAHVRAYAIRPYTSSLILITTTLNYTLFVKSNSTIHPKLLSLYNMNNSSQQQFRLTNQPLSMSEQM